MQHSSKRNPQSFKDWQAVVSEISHLFQELFQVLFWRFQGSAIPNKVLSLRLEHIPHEGCLVARRFPTIMRRQQKKLMEPTDRDPDRTHWRCEEYNIAAASGTFA